MGISGQCLMQPFSQTSSKRQVIELFLGVCLHFQPVSEASPQKREKKTKKKQGLKGTAGFSPSV